VNLAANEEPVARDINRPMWRAAALIVVVLWIIYFSYLTALRLARLPDEDDSFLLPRLLVTLAGVAFSFGIIAIQARTAEYSLARRIAITAACAVVGSALHGAVNCIIFYGIYMPDQTFSWSEYIPSLFDWLWFYTSLSAMILAVSYSAHLRERDRRMADLAAKAHAAQLRALRYQLNPHFLFNTLNSIVALVARNERQTAMTMIENLSDFLRTGLALDPLDDIPLKEELELQTLYFEIERQRFPDRLDIEIAVPEGLEKAMVPSLITQPLIENAVKYAVSRSSVPVRVEVSAWSDDDTLHVGVVNDSGDAPSPAGSGTRVGLSNVEGRLRARFGAAYEFRSGPRPEGGFEVFFALPLRFQAAS
jgi:hypothetical protein